MATIICDTTTEDQDKVCVRIFVALTKTTMTEHLHEGYVAQIVAETVDYNGLFNKTGVRKYGNFTVE